MPAPRWFFRVMYDRESEAWARQRHAPSRREAVERFVDELAGLVAPPGPVVDLGSGPGAHALALARRGYTVVGIDGSPRMVEVARAQAAKDGIEATFAWSRPPAHEVTERYNGVCWWSVSRQAPSRRT